MADVTVAALVYRDIRWIEWMLEGLRSAKNRCLWRKHIVANDATPEVLASDLIEAVHTSPDPSEYYINRVYRAWNMAVLTAPTQYVVLMNSDMYASDHWLDELVMEKKNHPMHVPCSLLVESGRIPSAMPEYVKDFGRTPEGFDAEGFRAHARRLARPMVTEPGRLYMPVLVERGEFLDIGGYPPRNPRGTTGDKDLFRRYTEAGFEHVTCLGSVVAHIQEGERRG